MIIFQQKTLYCWRFQWVIPQSCPERPNVGVSVSSWLVTCLENVILLYVQDLLLLDKGYIFYNFSRFQLSCLGTFFSLF